MMKTCKAQEHQLEKITKKLILVRVKYIIIIALWKVMDLKLIEKTTPTLRVAQAARLRT